MNAGLLYVPRPARVKTNGRGRPIAVEDLAVEAVREEWLVEDRWWAERPIARHYFELVLESGRCMVIFHESGRWFEQRA